MNYDYWQKQEEKPLFPEIEWNRPEQKLLSGKLLLVGGNKLSFSAVSQNYAKAIELGAGEVKVVLPDSLKKILPKDPGIIFAESNQSGGFSDKSRETLEKAADWSDVCLIIGDLGKNSQTTIAMEQLLKTGGKAVLTRDTVDLVANSAGEILQDEKLIVIASFSQLQKIFRSVFYPKVLTFNIQLSNLVENLHKFTITYQSTIAVLHQDTLIVGKDGKVVTVNLRFTKYSQVSIWSGEMAVKSAINYAQNPTKPLESVVSSLV